MNMITKQNSFSRVIHNQAKMGAYYTDTEHCKWISNFLEFPEEEVAALEPSIGDGSAIKAIVPENAKIFGVELNSAVAEQTKKDIQITKVINEDFLNGVKISHNSFGFCFSNPPYGETEDGKGKMQRLERAFLEKLTPYLKVNGVLAYVIPYSVFSDEGFLRIWCNRYATRGVYKFHEKEFAKYKQIVVFGVKKHRAGYLKEEFESLLQRVNRLEKIQLLPKDYDGEKIPVPSALTANIDIFATLKFDPQDALPHLNSTALFDVVNHAVSQKAYRGADVSDPVIKLKKDLMYLLAISGAGQGLAGDENVGDLHLQRGVVKEVEASTVEETAAGSEKYIERVKKSHAICMSVIENDGKITRFE